MKGQQKNPVNHSMKKLEILQLLGKQKPWQQRWGSALGDCFREGASVWTPGKLS